MKSRTVMSLLRSGQIPLLVALDKLTEPLYRASFLAEACRTGLLRGLVSGPVTLDAIVALLELPVDSAEPLQIWLDLGVRLGELTKSSRGYALRGWWAKKLANPRNDTTAAALEEVVRFHHEVMANAPTMLREGRRLSLADQDGELIARATRILEYFVQEAVDLVVPTQGRVRLLEVGCGEGAHVRYAAERNPELHALALDLQPEVADRAAQNIRGWGLGERVRVMAGDVRTTDVGDAYDVVTLFNLIYYFPFTDRVALLERLHDLVRPGGSFILTTGCPGGNMGLDVISLWFAASDLGGRLPAPEEMVAQMQAAGFEDVRAQNLMAGPNYFYAFTARRKSES